MKTYEELVEEAYQNAHDDRERLKKVLTDLQKAAEIDPSLVPTVAKTAVFITDSLTRSNAQLVELVKVEAKNKGKGGGDGDVFSEEEAESLWDGIGEGPSSEKGEN